MYDSAHDMRTQYERLLKLTVDFGLRFYLDLDLIFGSQPSGHYFRSVCLFVCLFVCLIVQFFSAVFDPISIKLGHMLYVWV